MTAPNSKYSRTGEGALLIVVRETAAILQDGTE